MFPSITPLESYYYIEEIYKKMLDEKEHGEKLEEELKEEYLKSLDPEVGMVVDILA